MKSLLFARSTIAVLVGAFVVACYPMHEARAQSLDDNQGAIEVTNPDETAVDTAPPARQPVTPKPGTRVGRDAAAKYMTKHEGTASAQRAPASGGGAHYLALHVGSFVSDNSYRWGDRNSETNVGKWNLGVTYRIGEWTNSMDLAVRVDVARYALSEGGATKLSFLPVMTFPDASSKFPLYFGAGAGLGVFMNQVSNESSVSLDYQLFGGVRFFDLIDNTGFFIEAGLKNHFLLLSDGQFNGTFVAVGAVFTF